MAKSLRAKSHLAAKSVKRRNEFQKVVDARAERVSEKLKQDLMAQKMKELKDGTSMDIDTKKDDDESKKVSTSGWRDARHHNYKKAKKMKNSKKKVSFTKF
ncbi:uncharacterized protein TDEL_0F02040 [Torulaspora delbrueckii]|uniref:DUF2423 domain-containing protein n=1 Tax=Torulaspora delbrueckii TaxID=4950 RepID=G8ZWM1_TORDE|nr:hypothetical protein TDEL_0F02040 [Torulaspora delbrueckii]CCE93015.1 hypothetical protein TDEL_0F02040 [Torulaspora delbrueckii]